MVLIHSNSSFQVTDEMLENKECHSSTLTLFACSIYLSMETLQDTSYQVLVARKGQPIKLSSEQLVVKAIPDLEDKFYFTLTSNYSVIDLRANPEYEF